MILFIIILFVLAVILGVIVGLLMMLVRLAIFLGVPILIIWGISRLVPWPTSWRRLFNGIDNNGDEKVQEILAGLGDMEPERKTLSLQYDRGGTSYKEWSNADPDKRQMEMVFVRQTPDGDLRTRLWYRGRNLCGSIDIDLPNQNLLRLRLAKTQYCHDWGSGSGVTKNKLAVECLREWMELRAETPREAEAKRQAEERAAIAEMKRLNELDALKKKYLP